MKSGAVTLVAPVMQFIASFICNIAIKKIASWIIKSIAAILTALFILLCGYVIPDNIGIVILLYIFFSFTIGFFFIANSNY